MESTDTASGAVRTLATSFNHFGFSLYRELPTDGNAFFSPLSVAVALAAVLPGARADTARELGDLLGVGSDPEPLMSSIPHLLELLGSRTTPDYEWDTQAGEARAVEREVFRLSLATGLFVEEAYPLHTAYCDLLADVFRADFFSVHFRQLTQAASRINQWVAERTEGRIPEIVSPETLSDDTRLILANAVYFLGQWEEQFSEHATRPQRFNLLPGATPQHRDVPMMRISREYHYWSDDGMELEALQIPYVAELSMLVLLPGEGVLHSAEAHLTETLLDRIDRERQHCLVDLQLPRFEVRTGYALQDSLQAMGARSAFQREKADFGGITPHAEGLWFSQMIHDAWVKVDEHGTEAAAATISAVLGKAYEAEPVVPIPFVVDRPFFFLIREHRTGAVLFFGRVVDPSA